MPLFCLQVDAKLAEAMLREELTDQQTHFASSLRSALQEQQRQLEAMQADLKSKADQLQAAMKALETHSESKVSSSVLFLVFQCHVTMSKCCCNCDRAVVSDAMHGCVLLFQLVLATSATKVGIQ